MKHAQHKLPNWRKHERGFTLIEMVVASGIFATAMVVMIGALISLESASRKARATRIAMDNVGAAIDSMSRTMRMGNTFSCGINTCPTGPALTTPTQCEYPASGNTWGVCVAFEHQNGSIMSGADQYIYRRSINANGNGQIERSKNSGTSWEAMTAPEINIEQLKFWVGGVDTSTQQPYVTMVIRGTASTSARTWTSFNVQTSISQRVPNFDLTP